MNLLARVFRPQRSSVLETGGSPPHPGLDHLRLEVAELAVAELRRLGSLAAPLSGPALKRAADCALVCARLEQRARAGENRGDELRIPDPAHGLALVGGLDGAIETALASAETRADLVALLEAGLIDTADLYSADDALVIDPTFALSAAVGVEPTRMSSPTGFWSTSRLARDDHCSAPKRSTS